jgi:glycosyltransferase involved in cell wall biosynthesis
MGSEVSPRVRASIGGLYSVRERIPVIIPTLNAGPGLADVLRAIRAQEGPYEAEVIAIDSGSIDGTLDCLRRQGARVLNLERKTFNHGRTRNEALKHAESEFAVLLVQDAAPASMNWLAALVDPLRRDGSIAGTFARQRPAPGASRVTAYYLEHWVAAQSEPRIVGPLTPSTYAQLSPSERHAVCAFDNVCSCVRLSVWADHQFPVTPIAEDLEWARDVLLAGHRLAYVPEAVVEHSHERPVTYELQRTYLVHQRLQAIFGLSTIPTLGSLMRAIASTVTANARLAAHEPRRRFRAMVHGVALGIAQPLGQYLGARSSRERREFVRAHGI